MKDRVVFITGAKGGLGSFITRRFLETGATVVGASRSISQQDFPGPNFAALAVDFTQAASVSDAVQSVITRFGRLDVLVHLLGGFAGGQTVAETDDATWERMRDLNLTSSFYVLRAAVPHLRKSGKGRVVAIGSLTAVEPHPALGAYVTFKVALAMLARTVALENKDAGLTAHAVPSRKNLKGWFLGLVVGTIGKGVLEKAFKNSVRAIEARNSAVTTASN